jgi:hypothetical protein
LKMGLENVTNFIELHKDEFDLKTT